VHRLAERGVGDVIGAEAKPVDLEQELTRPKLGAVRHLGPHKPGPPEILPRDQKIKS
jgi:hypothetical protein